MRATATSIVAAVAWTAGTIVSASAETINVYDNHGGSVAEYDARWSDLAARGVNVRIVGPCQSACTVLLAHLPNDRICVTPQASFGFPLAHRPDATAMLGAGYSADLAGVLVREIAPDARLPDLPAAGDLLARVIAFAASR